MVAAAALILIYATFDKPRFGDPEAPAQTHVAPWYLEKTPEYIGIPNVVTAVLGSFRGYDTLGEVFVVFTAGIGVLFLLGGGTAAGARSQDKINEGLRHHLIPRVVGRVLIPFILLFGLYVQFHGEYGPGGGFQAGAIVAAAIILFALLEGEQRALAVLPEQQKIGVGSRLVESGLGACHALGEDVARYLDGAYQLALADIELLRTRVGVAPPRDVVALRAWRDVVKAVNEEEIAKLKMQDLSANDIDAAMKTVMGTARSIGIEVG